MGGVGHDRTVQNPDAIVGLVLDFVDDLAENAAGSAEPRSAVSFSLGDAHITDAK
jgi:hypothetical protein